MVNKQSDVFLKLINAQKQITRKDFKIKQLEDKIKRMQSYTRKKTACRNKLLKELDRAKLCMQMQGFKCTALECHIDFCPFKDNVIKNRNKFLNMD